MPFFLNGQLTIGLGATLSMQPGVIVKSYGGGSILVQRAITAVGRTAARQPDRVHVVPRRLLRRRLEQRRLAHRARAERLGLRHDRRHRDRPAGRASSNCVFRYGGSGTTYGRPALRELLAHRGLVRCSPTTTPASRSRARATRSCTAARIYGNTYFGINNTGNAFCVNAAGQLVGRRRAARTTPRRRPTCAGSARTPARATSSATTSTTCRSPRAASRTRCSATSA